MKTKKISAEEASRLLGKKVKVFEAGNGRLNITSWELRITIVMRNEWELDAAGKPISPLRFRDAKNDLAIEAALEDKYQASDADPCNRRSIGAIPGRSHTSKAGKPVFDICGGTRTATHLLVADESKMGYIQYSIYPISKEAAGFFRARESGSEDWKEAAADLVKRTRHEKNVAAAKEAWPQAMASKEAALARRAGLPVEEIAREAMGKCLAEREAKYLFDFHFLEAAEAALQERAFETFPATWTEADLASVFEAGGAAPVSADATSVSSALADALGGIKVGEEEAQAALDAVLGAGGPCSFVMAGEKWGPHFEEWFGDTATIPGGSRLYPDSRDIRSRLIEAGEDWGRGYRYAAVTFSDGKATVGRLSRRK